MRGEGGGTQWLGAGARKSRPRVWRRRRWRGWRTRERYRLRRRRGRRGRRERRQRPRAVQRRAVRRAPRMPVPGPSSASPPRSLALPPPVLPLRRVPPLARRLRGRGRRRLDDREGRARRRLWRGREDEVEGPPLGHCFRGGVELAREVLGRWRDGNGEWDEEREVERGHLLPGGRRAAEQWTGEGVPSCAAAGGARHRPSERGREEKREEDVPCSASPDCARTHKPPTRASSREQCPP